MTRTPPDGPTALAAGGLSLRIALRPDVETVAAWERPPAISPLTRGLLIIARALLTAARAIAATLRRHRPDQDAATRAALALVEGGRQATTARHYTAPPTPRDHQDTAPTRGPTRVRRLRPGPLLT